MFYLRDGSQTWFMILTPAIPSYEKYYESEYK